MRKIEVNELKTMEKTEGLILQGCGGDLQEWIDGLNESLKEEGILIGNSKLREVMVFEHDGLTNLLFPLNGVEADRGRLAMWRLQTHSQFGGTWLSDYVRNRLGGFTHSAPKPDCPLIGTNGNIYHLMAVASQTLKEHGQEESARKMVERITNGDCHSYEQALNILDEYVNITSQDEMEQDMTMDTKLNEFKMQI